MNYTNCWLTYPLLHEEAGKTLAVSTEFSNPVAQSAFEELKLGFGGMYQRSVRQVTGDADLVIRKNSCLHPEG